METKKVIERRFEKSYLDIRINRVLNQVIHTLKRKRHGILKPNNNCEYEERN